MNDIAKKPTTNIDLFTPVTVGDLVLQNRIVMAPMTRNRAGEGGVPQPMSATYYAQRATAGLIISEASPISPQGIGYPSTPGIYTPAQINGWKPITDAVHQQNGRIFLQLWHVGRISHPSFHENNALPVAPSAVKPAGEAFTYQGLQPFETPRALETDEIPAIVSDYATAAANAKQAGFDGVEIHGANGYLIDQFLRDGSNKRQDHYGGTLANRARFLLEVVNAVTEVWDPARVGVRLSPASSFNDMSDSKPQLMFDYVAEQLSDHNLAYLHVVELNDADPDFDFVGLRNNYQGMYMANAGYDMESATRKIQSGQADLVSFGKLYIANPDLPERFAERAPLNEADPDTFYGGDERGFTDYPAL
ncbi:MAG: alkene reductase [Gammaproteobacteria bacterium]|jgi:N-ethylmaleimide reductase